MLPCYRQAQGIEVTLLAVVGSLPHRNTVTMDATSIESIGTPANSYIDYTVTVNSVGLTTTGSTPVTGVEILNIASLAAIATESHAIALSVDATTFDPAVSGS